MKSDELLTRLAEINEKYGPVLVQVYDRDYPDGTQGLQSWKSAEIAEIRVDGMEVELWI